MVGKFLLGVVSGGLLVTGGLVIGSAIFPLETPEAANTPLAATETATAPAESTAEPAAADPAPVSSEPAPAEPPTPEAAAEPASDAVPPLAETAAETAVVDPEPAAEPLAEPATEAVAALSEVGEATIQTEPETAAATEPAPEAEEPAVEPAPVAEAPVQPEADETAVAQPETAAPEAVAMPEPAPTAPVETVEAPAEPALAAEAGAEALAPGDVAELVLPLPPVALPQLDTDAVLAALDESTKAPDLPTPTPEPEAAPDAEVAEAAPEAASPADSTEPETAALPGSEVPDMPGERTETLPDGAAIAEGEAEALPAPEVATMPEIDTGPTFKTAPGIGRKSEGVIVGRLPRIGDAPEVPAEADEAGTEEALPEDPRPIARFAAAFENTDAKPVLAIVLIDPGTADLDREGLAALPFPVSLALDPMDPATPDRAAIYRAGGKEVVMLATGLAEGAVASDVEVSFQAMAQGLPEAVAVMDLPEALFQNNRPLASLVVPVVGAQGRGLLTWDQGLNAADQVARREDIAAAVVFRDLASAGDDSASIRRILDRAVFKAGQDGRVALAGTASPGVIAALLEWTVEGRAATVAIAPLTAVMAID